MSNLQIKDAAGEIKYLDGTGAGTDEDPFVPRQQIDIIEPNKPLKILPFKQMLVETTLAAETVVNGNTFEVTSTAGISIGKHVSIQNSDLKCRFECTILDIAGTTISVDSPLCQAIPVANTTVSVSSIALNVDGSSTQEVFSLQNGSVDTLKTMHVTRLMINILTSSTGTMSDFGDISDGLEKGIVLRKKDGVYFNFFNIKSNFDIALIGYDLTILSSVGVDGVTAQITFAGTDKMGSVIELLPGEDLELIIQDDLTSLTKFEVTAQGHKAD